MNKNLTNTPLSAVKPSVSFDEFIGLRDCHVLSVERDRDGWIIAVEQPRPDVVCSGCSRFAVIKERPVVRLTDRPAFDRPVVIIWRKYRMECPNPDCAIGSWTIHDPRIASTRTSLTKRAAHWVTREIGKGRDVAALADELRCDWSVVDDAIQIYGQALLDADKDRVGKCEAVGLDETLFVRVGDRRVKHYCTTIADVRAGKVIDVVISADYLDVAAWFDAQPESWKQNISFGTLDMSKTYRAIYREMLVHVQRVCDPYHVIQLANRALDEIRRRVQNQTLGHRGTKRDPLYRIRKLLLMAKERLDHTAKERLDARLALGDPDGEVGLGYLAKEAMRDFYKCSGLQEALELLGTIIEHCAKKSMPQELQRLAKTLQEWKEEIINWHIAKVSNGPTEALNNLIKRVKRVGFGFRNFQSYRIRILLYAGKPNWRILNSIVVP